MEDIGFYYRKPAKSKLGVASIICYIVGIIAILVSAVSFISLLTKEYTKNKPYVYSNSILGIPFEFSITLKDNGVATVSTSAFLESETSDVKYYITDGILYMESEESGNSVEKVGKINATKIAGESGEDGMSMDLVCKSAKIQQNISIAVISVGAVVLLSAIIMTIINKKNKQFI